MTPRALVAMFVSGLTLPALLLLSGPAARAASGPTGGATVAATPVSRAAAPSGHATASVTADRLPPMLPAEAVDAIGLTVSSLDAAVAFYTRVLTFTKESEVEASGRPQELLTGVFGARIRTASLRLGDQRIELSEFVSPRGRPFPSDAQANDHAFQHIAIVVSDMDAAYARLRAAGVAHASSGPQRLPDWNPNAGGIQAFYFRDPDGHFLEVLQFPRGKGDAPWHRTDRLFLGIDHTAIVVSDTERSLAFYRDQLGLKVAGESENYAEEQEHLNGVFAARLRITTLRAATGPGIEFLEYLAPSNGRPAPTDLAANDLLHWQTTIRTRRLDALMTALRARWFRLVSPGPVPLPNDPRWTAGALVRDLDGHGVRLVDAGVRPERRTPQER